MRIHAVRAAQALSVALVLAGPAAGAADRSWMFTVEPIYMEANGHDQHVLTIHEVDLGPPQFDNKTAVNLDTESDMAFRITVENGGESWTWGASMFLFFTSQSADPQTLAADGAAGPIEEAVFEVADQSFTSTDPTEVLYYEVLEDTDLEIWTADFYATKSLTDKPDSSVGLQLGLRLGDFDNDYFAVVGVQDVNGSFLGSSSNYDRMMGPLVGLTGTLRAGRNEFQGYFGQSVLLGSAVVTSSSDQFTGPMASPTFTAREVFRADLDISIPVTEFRFQWTYRLSETVSAGVGANTSTWWDVPVPPGVIPGEGGDDELHENTIVFFGLVGAVRLTF